MQIATFGQRLERAMMDEGYTQASLVNDLAAKYS